jgi:hypothetical protein
MFFSIVVAMFLQDTPDSIDLLRRFMRPPAVQQDILVVGWREQLQPDDDRTGAATVPRVFTIDGLPDNRPISLVFPLRVERIALVSVRSPGGAFYGVRAGNEYVYLRSSDIVLSPRFPEDVMVAVPGASVVSGFFASDANLGLRQTWWAERVARVPICPGDRRCEMSPEEE